MDNTYNTLMKLPTAQASIRHFINPLKIVATITALSCISSASLGQTNKKSEQWYQVELFVFANTNPDTSNGELWPEDLGLKYPNNTVILQDGSASDIEINQLLSGQNQPTTADNSGNSQGFSRQQQNETNINAPQPFALLTPDQYVLNQSIRRILAQSDFKLLFHGAWRQLINKRSQSESILIQGGEKFDQHYELEGSIKLSVERYLHIYTDLWLSSFVDNSGDAQQFWPVLPRAPIPSNQDQNNQLFSANSQEQPMSFNNTSNSELSLENSLNNSLFDNAFQDLNNNQYAVEKTVVMRQHRRMRSGELHYIDHPKMGLLIKITPYDIPEVAIE